MENRIRGSVPFSLSHYFPQPPLGVCPIVSMYGVHRQYAFRVEDRKAYADERKVQEMLTMSLYFTYRARTGSPFFIPMLSPMSRRYLVDIPLP